MAGDNLKPTHSTALEQGDRATVDRLQEVWDTVATLDADRMAKASRTALEMHMRNEIPDEEYGAVCFYLGTRAGETADYALGLLSKEQEDVHPDLYGGKPRDYWLAVNASLSALSQTLEQRAWIIEEGLQAQGKTCLTKRPEVEVSRHSRFTNAIAVMRSGGVQRQASQDALLQTYGSDVDRDVGTSAPKSAGEAFGDLLSCIPGAIITPEMRARLANSTYTIIGEYSAATTLIKGEGRGNFVEADVNYSDSRGSTIEITRYTGGKGVGIRLNYGPKGDLTDGEMFAQDADLEWGQGRIARQGKVSFDENGRRTDNRGRVQIQRVVSLLLDKDSLGKPDDRFSNFGKGINYLEEL